MNHTILMPDIVQDTIQSPELEVRPVLSFVIPCYNEEDNVAAICAAVTAEAERHVASHEIILIDNGSTDATRQIIRQLCEEDRRIKAIFNSRNFGQMRSPTHAIFQTTGQAVIGLCADFQDPPNMIGQFVQHWKEGKRIVLAQRRSEKTSFIMRIVRDSCYNLLAKYADYPAIPNVTGFGLYDRKVVDAVAAWNEPEPFFRGMIIETGYSVQLIPYDRPDRIAGKTKNNFRTLLDFALASMASSTRNLLRLPLLWAPFFGLIGAILMVCSGLSLFWNGPAILIAIVALQFGFFSVLLGFLGLLGIQIRTISDRSRQTPLVIEEERLNFTEKNMLRTEHGA
ncbi:glycosyltransferase family 2 protein [Sphingorhabdus arenilitoris]|uniref:Glycosyltransferase family 2 protein n=1 Tax=Sphingorhabdus arenilitoris TaxID=1490041 RepID=A0ABV8RCV4_9SPHN